MGVPIRLARTRPPPPCPIRRTLRPEEARSTDDAAPRPWPVLRWADEARPPRRCTGCRSSGRAQKWENPRLRPRGQSPGEASYRSESASSEAHGSAAQPRPVCLAGACGSSSVRVTIGGDGPLVKHGCEVIRDVLYFTCYCPPYRRGRLAAAGKSLGDSFRIWRNRIEHCHNSIK
jgi:hypothetical protein